MSNIILGALKQRMLECCVALLIFKINAKFKLWFAYNNTAAYYPIHAKYVSNAVLSNK